MLQIKNSFFNYHEWCNKLYEMLKDGDIFVEIGTWTGASSLFFGELIKNGNKKIDFYTIDTFKGSEEHKHYEITDQLYEYYMAVREPLKDYIKVIKADSQLKETSDKFKDESLAAVFIDGDHSHEGIKKDLENWYPKIKKGGIISGHDYIWVEDRGVKVIVDAFAGCPISKCKYDVWYYTKK